MESKNKLNEIALAELHAEELKKIKELEQQLEDKYYLMALRKEL